MKMENAENTMPFICSPILTHVHTYTGTLRTLTHSLAHWLTTWIFVHFTCVISLVWPCICINPANVTAALLLCFGLLVMHSFSRAQTHLYTHTYTNKQKTHRETEFNPFPYSMSCSRLLTQFPSRFPPIVVYISTTFGIYISACVYAEYKIPFFLSF